eukprot:361613-Chlamydomonas_euryale.AAC.5
MTRATTASASSSASSPIFTTSGIWASSPHPRRASRIARSRLRSLCSLGRLFLLLPRAWRITRDRRPREERCDIGLVMLGHGLGSPALERRGAKEVLGHLFTSRWAALSWIGAALRLTDVLKKGVFESRVPHDTAVPTLEIARPTCLQVSAACPQ